MVLQFLCFMIMCVFKIVFLLEVLMFKFIIQRSNNLTALFSVLRLKWAKFDFLTVCSFFFHVCELFWSSSTNWWKPWVTLSYFIHSLHVKFGCEKFKSNGFSLIQHPLFTPPGWPLPWLQETKAGESIFLWLRLPFEVLQKSSLI